MASKMRTLLAGAAMALPLLLASPGGLAAKDAPAAKDPKDVDADTPAGWKVKRTPWGDPDLRGKWPIDYLAQTPRVRPLQYGNRAELNDQEYAAALKAAEAQNAVYAQEEKAGKMGMGHWTERGKPLRQTSLTVLPANGRMPAMTEEGARLAALTRSSWSEDHWNWVSDFSPFDLCITRGLPGSMLPGAYNMGIGVWQSPGYVAIQLEMVHETRIIPLDGRAPLPAGNKGWLGVSRGHWEGDSLIIETTNFKPGVPLGTVDGATKPVPNSDKMKMKERLTPTGPNTIRYEAWIEDPVVLKEPFKLDFPWRRNDDYVIYEYACHEGNVQTRGFIEATSTNPRLAAKREAKWKELGIAPGKNVPVGLVNAAPIQTRPTTNAVGEEQH